MNPFNGSLTRILSKPKPKLWDFKVFVSLCIHRTIDAMAMDSLIKTLCWPNPKFIFSRTAGDAQIDRVRSQEAASFIKTDADVMLFIDDDIVYEPEDAVKVCREAYERKTVVGGTYVIKKEQYTWITAKPLNKEPIYFKPDAELVEVFSVATGFMAIPRNVIETMMTTLPYCHPTDLKFHPYFQPMPYQLENGDYIYLSEDWAFCVRARELGYKIYLDPSIRLGHAGRYIYTLDDLCRDPKPACEVIKYNDWRDAPATSKVLGENITGEIK